MSDDQSWNLSELKGCIKARFGKEHAERASLSIQSVLQRLAHFAFHRDELIKCSEKFEAESRSDSINRIFAKEDGQLNEKTIQFSAHAIAAVQALHAVTDLLGSAIYLSFNNVSQWKGNLKSAIKSSHDDIKQLVDELQDHSDYSYLNAVVNQSKHRNVVRVPLVVAMSDNSPPRFQFETFKRDAESYSSRDVISFLDAEGARQHDVILRIGIKLNGLANAAISS